MKCFYHNDIDAIGLCKTCNKGLCPECAVDVGNGLACVDSCEKAVLSYNKMIDKNIELTSTSVSMIRGGPAFFLAALFIVFGAFFMFIGSGENGTRFTMGLIFLFFGIVQVVLVYRRRDKSGDGA